MTLEIVTDRKFNEISRKYIDDGSEPDLNQLVPMFAEGYLAEMRKEEEAKKKS